MARWRDVKKGKTDTSTTKNTIKETIPDNISVSPLLRIKAFITDMFMIMMPIMYTTTYIILDGKDSFQSNEIARWLTMLVYGIITVVFWVRAGQTPGFKAYDIQIIDDNTKKKLSYPIAIFRYMMFIISAVSFVGLLVPFFRKDKKTLQDMIMQTSVVYMDKR